MLPRYTGEDMVCTSCENMRGLPNGKTALVLRTSVNTMERQSHNYDRH